MTKILEPQPLATDVLNRLLRLLCRSLPMYLSDAKPWNDAGQSQAQAALDHMAADLRLFSRRVAEAIVQRGGQPEPGAFPMEFAGLNDVALEYLLERVVERLSCDVQAIQHELAELAGDPSARELAEEVLGNAKGHLDILAALGEGRA